ncbi:anti-repressor SinI family protein [Alkalihalobacillus sp. TS-13]|nr:anti-repressor SinI family protein [Alkalihalobacillus sp. TS-13]
MEKLKDREKLDVEWIELMKVAKQVGMTKNEIRDFIRNFPIKSLEGKA